MKRSQRLPVLLSVLQRTALALPCFWLIGCAPEVYVTHPVSVSDSFEVDKRLIGEWTGIWPAESMEIEFDEASRQLYAIQHRERCKVEPIYTTQSNGQWFMNTNVGGAYHCTDPNSSAAPSEQKNWTQELHTINKYQITTVPLEDVLTAVTLIL